MTPAPSTEPPRIRTQRPAPTTSTAIGGGIAWALFGAGALAALFQRDALWLCAGIITALTALSLSGSVGQWQRARRRHLAVADLPITSWSIDRFSGSAKVSIDIDNPTTEVIEALVAATHSTSDGEAAAIANAKAVLSGHPSGKRNRVAGPLFRPGGDDATRGANS